MKPFLCLAFLITTAMTAKASPMLIGNAVIFTYLNATYSSGVTVEQTGTDSISSPTQNGTVYAVVAGIPSSLPSTVSGLAAIARGDTGGPDAMTSIVDIDFQFFVMQIAPPPVQVTFVPVDFDGKLHVAVGPQTSPSLTEFATATLKWIKGVNGANSQPLAITTSCVAPPNPGCQPSPVDLPYAENLLLVPRDIATGVGDLAEVELHATGGVGSPGQFAGSYTALADPDIFIDPSFRYANDFELVFSPNLVTSGAVPEPSTRSLLIAGAVLLIAIRRLAQSRCAH